MSRRNDPPVLLIFLLIMIAAPFAMAFIALWVLVFLVCLPFLGWRGTLEQFGGKPVWRKTRGVVVVAEPRRSSRP